MLCNTSMVKLVIVSAKEMLMEENTVNSNNKSTKWVRQQEQENRMENQ